MTCKKWVFPKIGVPQNGGFKMENPIKMDDLGRYHYFRKHPNLFWLCLPTFFFQSTCQDEMKYSISTEKFLNFESTTPCAWCLYIRFFVCFLRHLFGFATSNPAASFSRTTVELQHSDVSWLRVGSGEGKRWKDMIYPTCCWYFCVLARDLLQIT